MPVIDLDAESDGLVGLRNAVRLLQGFYGREKLRL